MLLKLCLPMIVLSLSACAARPQSFTCKPHKGFGCKSISAVNEMVDGGGMPLDSLKKTKPKPAQLLSSMETPYRTGEVRRQPEQTIKIWLAPYIDEQQTFCEAQVIHRITQAGRWVKLEPAL